LKSGGFGFTGASGLIGTNWLPGTMPFDPIEVTLGGTPGVEFRWPPKLIEVTEAGVPLICENAGAEKNMPPANSPIAATVAEFSRLTCQSYSSFRNMAPPGKMLYIIRPFGAPVSCVYIHRFDKLAWWTSISKIAK
jgi:hypothetical protein